ncbi:hypothetical protein Fcan01_09083 [Folsomia candida]|uniref:DUF4806 domain-containing protein n=1 Tax=Folsomia candida TaxID=158441 RepID=A0A226EDC8_FOLCA|nr:hypothetical protein Fcan01_09083 [Folsomia candida]
MSDILKNFVLFEFEIDKGVEVVQSTWISKDKTKCKFPNPIPKQFSNVQCNASALPGKDWMDYSILFVGTYDSYYKAIKKLKKYIKNKPIDSSENETLRRRRRKISREDTNLDPVVDFVAPGIDLQSEGNESFSGSPSTDSQISQVQVIQLEADPRIESLLTEFRKFQEEALRNQHLLLERVANLEKLIIKSTRLAGANCPITNINWPAKTLDELEEIEAILKNPATYSQQVSLLSKNNGNGLAPDVYAMLHSMIANVLRSQIRYTDKSNKIPFENRLSAKLVRDAIKSGKSHNAVKDSQINHQMGCWFRMKITSKTNNADITANTETSSREATSASTETDSDRIADSNDEVVKPSN